MEYLTAILLGSIAIIGVFIAPPAMVILILWLIFSRKNKRNKLRAEVLTKAIEHGQTLPENFFDEPKKQRNPLNIGIILMATGVGISLFLQLLVNSIPGVTPQVWTVGILPFLVGAAFLIIHFIEKKKPTDENAK